VLNQQLNRILSSEFTALLFAVNSLFYGSSLQTKNCIFFVSGVHNFTRFNVSVEIFAAALLVI